MVSKYPQRTSPRPYLTPTDAAPQPPALYEPKPSETHVHSWGTNLRCVGCGWTLHAVLARHRAEKEARP